MSTSIPRTNTGALASRWWNRLKALAGPPAPRRLARATLLVPAVRHWETECRRLNDVDLHRAGLRLRGRARGGESLDRLLPEAFGAVCVAAHRLLGLRPFDVQIAAGVVIHEGAIAELATGEGKTLVAVLPVFLNALTGKGVHVTTVNDYLARRDAEWTGPVYRTLGLTVGILQASREDTERAEAYHCDVTYGTAAEFGFDFLRDRLKQRGGQGNRPRLLAPWNAAGKASAPTLEVQREHHFALVDEADNLFLDEARTPLVIASATRPAAPEEQVVYRWANDVARRLERDRHFVLDEKTQKVELTLEGRQKLRWSEPPLGPRVPPMDKLREHVERALHAHHRFRCDQHYLIVEDKVEIVDEATGRRMPDRQWGEGLHQAVEAKEDVTITLPTDHAAQITFQSYFRHYEKLAGMTGTAAQDGRELRRVYRLCVVCVPTNRPVLRQQWPDRVFPSETLKFDAVVAEVRRLYAQGRPVLIGTRSVEKSEDLSRRLQAAGIEHQVLNARFPEQEGPIVAEAGQAGKVTVATNMAGRGTDIKLGSGVAEAGGLHVLGTERHESLRIDRQLAGRAGRQGDPGSCQFFVSLQDELLEGLGPRRQAWYQAMDQQGEEENWDRHRGVFTRAQRRLEQRHYRQRVELMIYEKRRQEILKDLGADPFVE